MSFKSLEDMALIREGEEMIERIAITKLTKMPEWKYLENFIERRREELVEEGKAAVLGVTVKNEELVKIKCVAMFAALIGYDRLAAVPRTIAEETSEVLAEKKAEEREQYEANGIRIRD